MKNIRMVTCHNCGKKLGEVNEEELSMSFEKGIKVGKIHYAGELIVAPYNCPVCDTTQMELIVVDK